MGKFFSTFDPATKFAINTLVQYGDKVDTGRWQGVSTEGKPDLQTLEILDLDFNVNCWRDVDHYGDLFAPDGWLNKIRDEIQPNLPWADEHFAERVGGVPLNPDPSHEQWPWWKGQDAETKDGGKFTHTYSERFWPKYAGSGEAFAEMAHEGRMGPNTGLWYDYGDYNDVLDLLAEDPYTRQAYLPIFFPEDTGAVHRGRIPCSLGYHFLLRHNRLSMWYEIRSCDAVRHFRDDLYLAVRLLQHTIDRLFDLASESEEQGVYNPWLEPPKLGRLYFKAHSFHVHMGDYHRL